MHQKFEIYQETQINLARNGSIYKVSLHDALKLICMQVRDVMEVEKISIWFFDEDKNHLHEAYSLSGENLDFQQKTINKIHFPRYFSHIEGARVYASSSSQNDPKLSEFLESYFGPLKIFSSIDAPVFSEGQMIGVIWIESVRDNRNWDNDDKSLASFCADLIGRIVEFEKIQSYEIDLQLKIQDLEKDLVGKLNDLKEAKLGLDLALEAAQAGKWDWDLRTNHLNLNETWYTRLGYTVGELPAQLDSFKHVVHPEDLPQVMKDINEHLIGKTSIYESRYRMITKTGEIQWVIDRGLIVQRSEDGKPERMTGVNVNITPIIQLEQNLLLSKLQLMAMIESLPTAVAMLDKNLSYLAYSSRWEQQWTQYGEVGQGQSIYKTVPVFRQEWVQYMKSALTGETLQKDEDFIELTPETYLWLRWIVQPWKDANGEIAGIIIMAEDITARKQAEIRIAQSSKLTALGEMAGGIAHEINNPLSIIKGYIDLLKRHSARNSLSQELMLQYIDKMDHTVGRISRIVTGMRRFSRESSFDQKIDYPINKIIDETLDICLERINNNGITVNVDHLDGAVINCRPVEISQVLLNLINNSFQAIANDPHPWIKIKCEEIANFYRVSIIDSGKGIDLSYRHKLFQPFFTTKEIGVGTGLGLGISKGIIEEHHGKLYYQDDAPNTTFVIELPKSQN